MENLNRDVELKDDDSAVALELKKETPLSEWDLREMYDTVLLEIKLDKNNLKRIYDRCDYFTDILIKALWDEKQKKNLSLWYNTKIIHMGNKSETTTLLINGEIIYKK